MALALCAIFVNVVLLLTTAVQTQDVREDRPSYRLPREVVPEHYDLEVHTHLGDDDEGFRFFGVVNITVSYDGDHYKAWVIG